MRISIALGLTILLASGCAPLGYVDAHHHGHYADAYQPVADGAAAVRGAEAVIADQHVAYVHTAASVPSLGAFGAGLAKFSGLSLQAFSVDGDLDPFSSGNTPGFFWRPSSFSSGDTQFGDFEVGTDSLIAWGSWANVEARLVTRDPIYSGARFEYVIGQQTPAASLPQSGLARYGLIGETRIVGGVPWGAPSGEELRVSTSSSLSVLWGSATPKVGLDLSWGWRLSSQESAYHLGTPGGVDNPGDPTNSLALRAGTATFGASNLSMDLCLQGYVCAADIEGFLAGPNAERAGLAYRVVLGPSGVLQEFTGTMAFAAAGSPAATPGSTAGVTPLAGTGPFGMARAGGPADLPPVLSGMNVLTQNATTGEVDRFGQGAFTIEFARGTAQSADLGGDALITWGRWTNGSYEEVQAGGNNPVALGAAQALHYVIGTPTPPASIPASGTANFTLMGATHPTWGDGALAAGTLTGAMAVAWGGQFSTRVGLDLTATMPGDAAYAIVTQGGLANPSQSQVQIGFLSYFSGTVPVSSAGTACTANPGACNAVINGLFAGPNAERAGIAYQIGSGNAQQSIYGAAAFQR